MIIYRAGEQDHPTERTGTALPDLKGAITPRKTTVLICAFEQKGAVTRRWRCSEIMSAQETETQEVAEEAISALCQPGTEQREAAKSNDP